MKRNHYTWILIVALLAGLQTICLAQSRLVRDLVPNVFTDDSERLYGNSQTYRNVQFLVIPYDNYSGTKQATLPAASVSTVCLAAVDDESEMTENPEHIGGSFKFDYKIEAELNFEMADTDGFNPEYYRGNPNNIKMVYYVNSSDGSMLFPGGPAGFFKTNFTYLNRFGRIDAAIWLPSGQMVVYGYDAEEDKNLAVTRESALTADQRWSDDYLTMMQFFSSSEDLAAHPEPMPSHVQWQNSTKGYTGKLIEGTGIENTWDIYFDTAPTPIKTSCIMMGYMVGVLKDFREENCNRLIVYSKVNIGGRDSGDSIEAALKSIKPMGISFDGSGYSPMEIGGDYGTAAFAKLDDFEARLRSIEIRRQTTEREKSRCMGVQFCIDRANTKLEELQKEKSIVICEQMVSMGMEETLEECMRNEGY